MLKLRQASVCPELTVMVCVSHLVLDNEISPLLLNCKLSSNTLDTHQAHDEMMPFSGAGIYPGLTRVRVIDMTTVPWPIKRSLSA